MEESEIKGRLRKLTKGMGRSPCRFCGGSSHYSLVDLGMSPFCEAIVDSERLNEMEAHYPLHVFICGDCFLAQLDEYVDPEKIFSEYAYFSSYSSSWVKHAGTYVDSVTDRFNLDARHLVMEIASNDGYLLQFFRDREIPCIGIEPAANVAAVATEKGIPTIVKFFGEKVANDIRNEHGPADLLIGNNVLAHVPNLNDFVSGIKSLLGPKGIVTMEFPHLLRLIEGNQFDTIYHEHFSYFSFMTVREVFRKHGLRLFDVEELSSHGGSLRIFATHSQNSSRRVSKPVDDLLRREREWKFDSLDGYVGFSEKVETTKRELLRVLIDIKNDSKSIVAYGAPGKGNTLLNYCGIGTDFIDYAVDRNPYKHGKYTPGRRIPIFHPKKIDETRPDYILILPWNLKREIVKQMAYVREWEARFIVPIPAVEVF